MGLFAIPYRWSLKTVTSNIYWMFYSIKRGIWNIIRWTPVIWHDKDCDWDSLAEIMEWKFRKISFHHKHYGGDTDVKHRARQTLICAELLKRLINDDESGLPGIPSKIPYYYLKSKKMLFERHVNRMNEWQKMLGKEIGRHLMEWWN